MTQLPAVVTIENLPTGTTLVGTELLECVQTSGGVANSVNITVSAVADLALPINLAGGSAVVYGVLPGVNLGTEFLPSTALPSGGTATMGLTLSSATAFGLFGGAGAPTFAAATGSLYMRFDGANATSRLYVNTSGTTTWTSISVTYSDLTFDPAHIAPAITLSNNNLTMSSSSANSPARCTNSYSGGKYFFAVAIDSNLSNDGSGVCNASYSISNGSWPGIDANSIGYDPSSGNIYINGSSAGLIESATSNSVIGIAVDLTNNLMWVNINGGEWNNSTTADPSTGVGGISISAYAGGTTYPVIAAGAGATRTLVTDQQPPSGFSWF